MMAGVRPFRFMVGSSDVVDARTLVERARWAESIGCSHICVHDHLDARLAPVPLLTAVAMATERIRLCPLVFNNDLRHPAVLAQELASLDILSGGRVEVGIGAGWAEREYRAAGIPYDRPGIRIERLTEAIAVLRGLFADGAFTYKGRYYSITAMDGQPKPVQRPHPPFVIGGTRERVLRLAAVRAGSPPAELFHSHVSEVDRLVTAWHGQKWVDLPGHLRAVRRGGVLCFEPASGQ